MALRPENLPRDPDRLIEMVLASEGKIEALQATIAKLRTIIFGARSEKSVVIIAEQLSLALGAIEAGVAAPMVRTPNAGTRSRRKRARSVIATSAPCPSISPASM